MLKVENALHTNFSNAFDVGRQSHFSYGYITPNTYMGIITKMFDQRTLTVGGRITVHLVSSLTRLELTKEGNIILFCEAV